MKLAGIITTKNYTDRYKSLLTMRKLVDVLIVLDDNSDTPISKKDYPYIDLLITQKHNEPFNCQANRTILFYWAGHYNCNWALQLDDDMILSNKINNRKKIEETIHEAESHKADVVLAWLRELWDSYYKFRMDGIWAHKTFPFLQRVWLKDKNISLRFNEQDRLHSYCFKDGYYPELFGYQYVIYHTGCITKTMRKQRVNKYKILDPKNKYQADYTYMLNEDGIIFHSVPKEDKNYMSQIL